MGFYGNIGNTATTGFTFDKTYPNRYYMDLQVSTDGVFIGRYVLVEYDINDNVVYKQLYKKDNIFYNKDTYASADRTKIADVNNGEIVYVMVNGIAEIYQVNIENNTLNFNLITDVNEENTYLKNYLIDKEHYAVPGNNFSKGYDSTVWQKVFTNGVEKYVQIAELNSVIPTFDITVDAPTINPAKPHFDADSSNVAYKLHLQPNWGFKVKNANDEGASGLSDFNASYTNSLNAPENAGGSFTESQLHYNGEIYINKAGFNSEISAHSDATDKIELTPTGKSGAQYSTHNPNNPTETREAYDMQELSIMLPSIGNAVATMWDMAYGPGDVNNENKRNRDIGWDSTQGLRLVKENAEGNGFTHSTTNVETLAGCINSVHDLMGMIIKNDTAINIESADADKIYFRDGKYYTKVRNYIYELANGNSPYKPINLGSNYEANAYYLKNTNEDYLLSTSAQPIEGVNYFTINATEKKLGPVWESGRYYYSSNGGATYQLDNNNMSGNYDYYDNKYNGENDAFKSKCITLISNANNIFITTKNHISQEENGVNYYFGLFYIDKDTNFKYPIKDTLPNADKVKSYFIGKYTFEQELDQNNQPVFTYTFIETITGNFISYDDDNKYYTATADENNQIVYTRVNTLPEDYYKQYIINKSNADKIPSYYTITLNDVIKQTAFFELGRYYILNANNYIKVTAGDYTADQTYYTIEDDMYSAFYQPEKYYYFENNEYILDNASEMSHDIYYEKAIQCVDPNYTGNEFVPGAIWNDNLIPTEDNNFNNIIYYRWDSWNWKELVGFARTLNTIHGLILRVNDLVKFDDKLTRDNNTVQGCINILNDIIARFDSLAPNQFTIVDEYGRIHSVEHSSDEWLEITVDSERADGTPIHFEHLYPNKSVDTESDFDVNGNGDTINLETIAVDETGHVINKNTNTVTLPFGYKTFVGGNNASGQTVAASTQATMTLVGDSWIKPEISTHTITYNHIGPVTSTEIKKNDLTPNFGESFEIEDWYFDEKGHKSNKTVHTVKIPAGSLNELSFNGSSVITGLKMTPSSGAIEQTNTDIGDLKLAGYTANTGALKLSGENTLNEGLAIISNYINNLDYSNDSATQFISKIEQTDGKISVTRSNAGSLVLGTATTNDTIAATDSLLNAFNKIEARIIADENRLTTLIGNGTLNAAFDTIVEISDWLDGAESGSSVENLFNSITENSNAIKAENLRALSAEAALGARINKLNTTVSANANYYISSITIDNDILTIGQSVLPAPYDDAKLQLKISQLEIKLQALQDQINALQGNIDNSPEGDSE